MAPTILEAREQHQRLRENAAKTEDMNINAAAEEFPGAVSGVSRIGSRIARSE
jgi:hypothetical protein